MAKTRAWAGGAAAAVAIAGALATAGASGAASAWTLRFSYMPSRAYQGLPVAVSVLVKPVGTTCSLAVRYADGSRQPGLHGIRAGQGTAAWTWHLGEFAPAGSARATVSCGRSGTLTSRFLVVGGTVVSGVVSHSKLAISDQGFSQRPDSYDAGSSVSYGVVLHNPSPAADAQNVSVLVNFLDASDHVLQSSTTRVPSIAAGSSFDLGGNASLPAQTPVSRLEIVVQTDSYAAHTLHTPAVENVHIAASTYAPGWVSEVDGDLVNDAPTDVLTNAQLSIVLYDAAGAIVGGGTGMLFSTLPPGTRAYFSATSGFSPIPIVNASVAAISVEPTYEKPGA
ncbi:MAG TPA: FxLYD domain-containing protein [Gaiellaceae bacterium]